MSDVWSMRFQRTPDAELIVMENSGHFFDDHLDELRKAVCDWTVREIVCNNE